MSRTKFALANLLVSLTPVLFIMSQPCLAQQLIQKPNCPPSSEVEKSNSPISHLERTNVYIVGAIQKPGPVKYTDGMTVLQVIEAAGGLRSDADRSGVRLLKIREGEPERPPIWLDLDAMLARTSADVAVEGSDVIDVPSKCQRYLPPAPIYYDPVLPRTRDRAKVKSVEATPLLTKASTGPDRRCLLLSTSHRAG